MGNKNNILPNMNDDRLLQISPDALPQNEQHAFSIAEIKASSETLPAEAPYPSEKLQFLAKHCPVAMKLCFALPESLINTLQQMVGKAKEPELFQLQLDFERLLAKEMNSYSTDAGYEHSTHCYNVSASSFESYCFLCISEEYTLRKLNDVYDENIKNNGLALPYIFSNALNSAYIGWLFSNAEFWQDLKLLQEHSRTSGLYELGYLGNVTDVRSKALASIIDSYFGSTPVFKHIFKNVDTLSIWPVYPEYVCFCRKWRLMQMKSAVFPETIDMLQSHDIKMHDDLCYPEAPPTVFHYYFDENFKKANLNDQRVVPKHLRSWAEMMQGGTGGINKALVYHRNLFVYIVIQAIEDRIRKYVEISNNIIKDILAKKINTSPETSYRILRSFIDAKKPKSDVLKNYTPIVETECYRELINRMEDNWFCVDDSIKLSGVYPIHDVKIETDPETNKIKFTGNIAAMKKAFEDYEIAGIDSIGKAENAIDCALILNDDSKAARIAGKSRDTIRRYKRFLFKSGPQALKKQMRDKPLHSNRVEPELEKMVLQAALEKPELDRSKISLHMLENFNIEISPSTVQSILSRHNLTSMQQRMKAQMDHVSPSSLIDAGKLDNSSTAFDRCSMEDIMEEFLVNPKITRTRLVNLLNEKYGIPFEPETLAGLIQHCARFIQEIRLTRTPVEERPGIHMTPEFRKKMIKSGQAVPFVGKITKSTPLHIT